MCRYYLVDNKEKHNLSTLSELVIIAKILDGSQWFTSLTCVLIHIYFSKLVRQNQARQYQASHYQELFVLENFTTYSWLSV